MKEDKQFYDAEFLSEMIDHLPNALVLLDHKMKIKFSNRLFNELFNSEQSIQFDEILGQTIRCKDFTNDDFSQPRNVNCTHCKLLKSVKQVISTKKTHERETIVLQTLQNEKTVLKLLQFQANYIQFKEQEFVLLIMNDITELGEETLNQNS